MGVNADHDKAWQFYSWAKSKGNQLAAACIYRINNEGYWEATNENRKIVINKLCAANGINCPSGTNSVPNVGYGSGSSSSNSHKKCGSCGGSGLCTTCNGQGAYWEEVGLFTGGKKKYITCPVCRGNKHCGVCRGNGYIY